MKRQYLQFTGPGEVELGEEYLPTLRDDQVLVKTHYSAISPGTEILIYQGAAPELPQVESATTWLPENLAFPVRYGYSLVGKVVEVGSSLDQGLRDRLVLAFHPHASLVQASPEQLIWLDPGITALDAVFLPNLETAVNLVHDGAPLLGEIVMLLGQGVVGLLTTALLSRHSLGDLIAVEPIAKRRDWAGKMGATTLVDPGDMRQLEGLNQHLGLPAPESGVDLCYELSGHPGALDQAIQATRFSGRIVLGSWYGTRPAKVDLGGRFHRSRIKIFSSQVSSLNPELSARWDKQRRLNLAQQLLLEIQPSQLITHTLPLEQSAAAYALLDQSPEQAIAVVFDYSE